MKSQIQKLEEEIEIKIAELNVNLELCKNKNKDILKLGKEVSALHTKSVKLNDQIQSLCDKGEELEKQE